MRKGNIRDVGFLVVVLFFIGIFCFIGYYTFNTISDKLIASSAINSTEETVEVLNSMKTTSGMFDYFGLAVFIGMSLAIIISGWFIGGNPIFIVIYFIVLIILVVASMILSNVWENVTSMFGYATAPLPITNHLITYLPIYICVVAFLGMVAMFGKPYMMGAEY